MDVVVVSFTNKFTGKVIIIGTGSNDLPGSIGINHSADLPSSVSIISEKPHDLPSSVNVGYSGEAELPSSIHVNVPVDLPSSVKVRARNKMTGIVEVVEPPVVKVRLSPIEDTHARDGMPKLNYGRDHDMFVGVDWNGQKYRSFLRFDISSLPSNKIIKKATLVLTLLNSRPPIPIGIYDIPSGETWTEYGLTWDNQPSQGTLIKSYDSGTYAGKTEIDLTSYIEEWYTGARQHNGFMLKVLDETELGRYKQYGTRESTSTPYIEIEYYDPYVFSNKKEDLPGSLFVFATGTEDLPGTVVVNGYTGEEDLPGSVIVRNPKDYVDDDLPSSVTVSRDYLPSTVHVTYGGQEDIEGSVIVRVESTDYIEGTVTVGRPELPGSVYITPYQDLPSSVHVKGFGWGDLPSTVHISKPEIPGSVIVVRDGYADLDGSVSVRQAEEADLPSEVTISRPELPGSVTVRSASESDIEGTLTVRVHGDSDLPGSVRPRVWGEHDLDSTVKVRVVGEYDLPSSVIPRVIGVADLPSSVIIQHGIGNYDLPSSVEVGDDFIGYVFIM